MPQNTTTHINISFNAAKERGAPIILCLPKEQALARYFGTHAHIQSTSTAPKTKNWISSRYNPKKLRVYNKTNTQNMKTLQSLRKSNIRDGAPHKMLIAFEGRYIEEQRFAMLGDNETSIAQNLKIQKRNTVIYKDHQYTIGMPRLHKSKEGNRSTPAIPYLETGKSGLQWIDMKDEQSSARYTDHFDHINNLPEKL